VTGREIPLRTNRELLLLAEVTVTSPPVATRLVVVVPLEPTPTLPTFKVAGVTVNCADCCDEAFAGELLVIPDPPQPSVEARQAMTARKVKTAIFRVGAMFMRKLSSLLDSSASESDVINPDFSLLQFALPGRTRNRSLKDMVGARPDSSEGYCRTPTFVSLREWIRCKSQTPGCRFSGASL
jgi:hypothetical protein